MGKVLFIVVLLLIGWVSYLYFAERRVCRFRSPEVFTIADVHHGPFLEWIPQTGELYSDSLNDRLKVRVELDEMYFHRMSERMTATSYINNIEDTLTVIHIDSVITDGRFQLEMKFKSKPSSNVCLGRSLRLRMSFGEPTEAILLPVGGFYKDTMGKWVYTVDRENRLTRREIKLGRRNTEYFEVLDGLKPGDYVLTSSYAKFDEDESIDLDDFEEEKSVY